MKNSVSRFAADSLRPEQAREVITEAAGAAVRRPADARLPAIPLPATLTVRFRNADLAEMVTWIDGVVRADEVTVHLRDDDPVRLYHTFVTSLRTAGLQIWQIPRS